MSESVRKATDTLPLPTFWAQAQLHLCVLGINLQGNEKTSKKKIALVSPNEKGEQQIEIPSQYQGPGVRAHAMCGPVVF